MMSSPSAYAIGNLGVLFVKGLDKSPTHFQLGYLSFLDDFRWCVKMPYLLEVLWPCMCGSVPGFCLFRWQSFPSSNLYHIISINVAL